MNWQDKGKYWEPAAVALFGAKEGGGLTDHELALEKALGVTLFSEWTNRPPNKDFPLTDEMRSLLTALAGPHGKTILKAYRIQKGLENAVAE